MIAAQRAAVSGPVLAAQAAMRSGVQEATCAVRGRHVLLGGGRAAACGCERTCSGDALALVVDLDGARIEAQLDPLAHEVVGHRVVVALELDVVVDVHAWRACACGRR